MKSLLILFVAIAALNTCAQQEPLNLVDSVLKSLNIEKTDCLIDFIRVKQISASESIVLIPEIEQDEDGLLILNGYLLIVNSKNREIKSQFSEKEMWFSDALRLEEIEITQQPYEISKDVETLSILVHYNGSSSVNPYNTKELSLFLRKGEKLTRILKDYKTYTFGGETDGNSNGQFVEHIKKITPKINSSAGFFNLKVADSIIKTQATRDTLKVIETSVKTEVLKYQNGIYQPVN